MASARAVVAGGRKKNGRIAERGPKRILLTLGDHRNVLEGVECDLGRSIE